MIALLFSIMAGLLTFGIFLVVIVLAVKPVREFCLALLVVGGGCWLVWTVLAGLVSCGQAIFATMEQHHREELALIETAKQKANADTSAAIANGKAQFAKAQYNVAESNFRKVVDALNTRDGDKAQIASALNNLAAAKQAQKNYQEAESLYIQAERSLSASQDQAKMLCCVLKNHAALLRCMQRYTDAQTMEERAEQIGLI